MKTIKGAGFTMRSSTGIGKGFHGDPVRHALHPKGIKTGINSKQVDSMIEQYIQKKANITRAVINSRKPKDMNTDEWVEFVKNREKRLKGKVKFEKKRHADLQAAREKRRAERQERKEQKVLEKQKREAERQERQKERGIKEQKLNEEKLKKKEERQKIAEQKYKEAVLRRAEKGARLEALKRPMTKAEKKEYKALARGQLERKKIATEEAMKVKKEMVTSQRLKQKFKPSHVIGDIGRTLSSPQADVAITHSIQSLRARD
jgi:hypothetical protein